MGKKINVPHPGEIIASSLKKYLARHSELGLTTVEKPETSYYTTDNPKLFKELAEKFLEKKITKLNKTIITDF
jgi:glutamate racemase